MWYAYIIKCSDDTLYTGITTDLARRMGEHNRRKGGRYTRVRFPVRLVYQEQFSNKTQALKREAEIKGWSRRKKQLLVVE